METKESEWLKSGWKVAGKKVRGTLKAEGRNVQKEDTLEFEEMNAMREETLETKEREWLKRGWKVAGEFLLS